MINNIHLIILNDFRLNNLGQMNLEKIISGKLILEILNLGKSIASRIDHRYHCYSLNSKNNILIIILKELQFLSF